MITKTGMTKTGMTKTGEAASSVLRTYGAWAAGGVILLFLFLLAQKVVERETILRRNAEGYAVFMKMYDDRPPATAFTLRDTAGQSVDLQSYRGKVLFLTFRTTW